MSPSNHFDLTRRALIGGLAGAAVAGSSRAVSGAVATSRAPGSRRRRASGQRYVVVGAGAFGSFTALALRRSGAEVTLVDTWGPGNARASSGGETRIIRGVYADRVYVEMVARAFELWAAHERQCRRTFYHRLGALWMSNTEKTFVRSTIPLLREAGFPFQELTPKEAAARYPQVSFEGIAWTLHEERAGYLLARQACAATVERFVAEGGIYRELQAKPGPIGQGTMDGVQLGDGSTVHGDAYVFACGPWLGTLFPDVLGERILPSRQEVFFFGTPATDSRFNEGTMPIWVEVGENDRLFYGIPGNEHRGFKVADDERGGRIDPTTMDRRISEAGLTGARALLARRFPALAGAPLLESRVCQYENTPDHHLLLDRHPAAANTWLVGGGSGHGFKLSPAWGERVAATVRGQREIDPFFGLARLSKTPTASS
jgi:sarcosine oxidase